MVVRRLKLDTICFAEADSVQELRLMDLMISTVLENLEREKPFILEEAFNPPKTSF